MINSHKTGRPQENPEAGLCVQSPSPTIEKNILSFLGVRWVEPSSQGNGYVFPGETVDTKLRKTFHIREILSHSI